jgi:Protein of unknown function (DUF3995)
MIYLISLLLATVFFVLSAIHVYWGFGGRWAMADAFPTKEDGTSLEKVPGMVASFVVAVGLFAFGIFYLIKSDILAISLPTFLLSYGYWVITVIFLLRAVGDFKYFGFFKKIKTTPFGKKDSLIYTPLCLFIGFSTTFLIACN